MKNPRNEANKEEETINDTSKSPSVIASQSASPFDLRQLRLSQDFAQHGGSVKKRITAVPARKPNKHTFVRVFAEEAYKAIMPIIELKDEGTEIYLVGANVREELLEELQPAQFVTVIDRQNNLSLWPIKLPKSDGRSNTWNESALAAAQQAEKEWVRVAPNMRLGAYDVFAAVKDFPEPPLPELNFQQLVELSFKDRFINSLDHPVLKKLRGEE